MIQIGSFRDLEKYGIDYLTGESCAYGYRGLCDLTDRGIKIIASCFGLDPELFKASLPDAWNSKGIKSMMISAQMIVPIGVFACFNVNCSKVYITYDDKVIGIEPTDKPEDIATWESWNQGRYCDACSRYGAGGGIALQYSNPGFSRHTHAMSGRTT